MKNFLNKLIPQIIQIEEKLGRIYNNVASIEGQYNQQLKIAALVMSRQMKEHADYYRVVEKTLVLEEEEVDEVITERMGKSLKAFKDSIQRRDIKEISDLHEYVMDIQNRSIDMMKEFQGEALPEQLQSILKDLMRNQEKNKRMLQEVIAKSSLDAK